VTGSDLSTFTPRLTPGGDVLTGTDVRLEPLDWAAHGDGLFAAIGGTENAALWDFVSVGPFTDRATFAADLSAVAEKGRWRTMVIVDEANAAAGPVLGTMSFMRLREEHGSCEIGCVVFSTALQRTRAATEAFYLTARHVFDDLGYRRYEWKCDDRNATSRRAAERFGFTYEGAFRNDMVVKGCGRDTAWYSITAAEWPAVKAALEAWLAPDNFDADGRQLKPLAQVRAD
jgi:RimJ/RimL family protein N-acetyltransferase